jgi:chemotaxis protein histidine kinase CheA
MKAGKTNDSNGTDTKAFIKKLTELTQTKGTEKSSNIIKLKDDKQKKTEAEGLDEETQMSIKQLLSHIKLNDKLAIEKSVKELREIAESKSKNGAKEIKDLKKLLAMAQKEGVEVTKLEVSELEAEDGKKEGAQKIKKKMAKETKEAKEGVETKEVKPELLLQKNQVENQDTKKVTNLATLLQDVSKDKKDLTAPKQKHHADKQKEIEKSGFKTQTDDAALTQKEEIKSAKEDTAQTAKQKSDSANLASLLSKSGFGELKEEKEKELSKALAATSTDTTQQTENDVKSKGAIAKEALKYLSEDIKETIDSYKPPMMKVSMEMNPQNMGAVDVTLISRGQNLIVNVASSQDNMQMFMQNIQEFRTNLNNLGFTSLEMNFNFSGQSQNSGGGNNDRQWREDSAKRYEANSKIGAITDKIESLDIILPHPKYA